MTELSRMRRGAKARLHKPGFGSCAAALPAISLHFERSRQVPAGLKKVKKSGTFAVSTDK
jgi:hypothetical protein